MNDENTTNLKTVSETSSAIAGNFLSAYPRLTFIYKKTEKITAAIHLVSNLIKDEDPIKWEMRGSAVSMLSVIAELTNTLSITNIQPGETWPSRFPDTQVSLPASTFTVTAQKLISLMEVSRMAGSVSEMNSAVIIRELVDVSTLVENEMTVPSGKSAMINRNFFDIGSEVLNSSPVLNTVSDKKQSQYKGQYKRHNEMSFIKRHKNPSTSSEQSTVLSRQDSNSNETRREAILAIIKDKKEVAITDLSGQISGCSSKTIQRDLLAMVGSGILKKEGDRRWSRYRLA